VRFATTIAGIGEPTIILVHGLASTRRIWDLVVPHLSRDHKVIAFDQRGHGETEKPNVGYSLEDLATDVDELIRRYGVSRPILVGHSAGANVVLHHAVTRRNARGVVLVDGAVVEMHAHLSWDEAAERLAPPVDDAHQIEKFVREGWPQLPNSAELVEIRRSFFEWGKGADAHKRLARQRHLEILRSLWEQDVHTDLLRLACPALMIVCRISLEKAPEQRWHTEKALSAARIARLPNVQLVWLEDTIHDVPVQRPSQLAEAIRAFARAAMMQERGQAPVSKESPAR
jgi:pimeloyl-ACP methyl ester carboxylesterase